MDVKEMKWSDWNQGLGQGQVAGICDNGIELSGCINRSFFSLIS
jgi:hypothetical protein